VVKLALCQTERAERPYLVPNLRQPRARRRRNRRPADPARSTAPTRRWGEC
jgi:hypothetical protein